MKSKLFIVLFLCISSLTYAQGRKGTSLILPAHKQIQFEFTTGAHFDLVNHNQTSDFTPFGQKNTVSPRFGMKMTHLFSQKLGWYFDWQMNFYKEKFPNDSRPDLPVVADLSLKALENIKPCMGIGMLYRIENNRWRFHPHIGLAYEYYLGEADNKGRISSKHTKVSVYKRDVNKWTANLGLTMNYYISPTTFLIFNATYHQPLQKSYARYTYTIDGVEQERKDYSVSSAGRNITTDIGIGFSVWKRP